MLEIEVVEVRWGMPGGAGWRPEGYGRAGHRFWKDGCALHTEASGRTPFLPWMMVRTGCAGLTEPS